MPCVPSLAPYCAPCPAAVHHSHRLQPCWLHDERATPTRDVPAVSQVRHHHSGGRPVLLPAGESGEGNETRKGGGLYRDTRQPGPSANPVDWRPCVSRLVAHTQFAADRVPSLFSMDVDGRVLRFDSMSKILCPGRCPHALPVVCLWPVTSQNRLPLLLVPTLAGLRIGFVTGPPGLVSRINLNAQSTCLHTSGLSQAMVLAFFQHYVRGSPCLGLRCCPTTRSA